MVLVLEGGREGQERICRQAAVGGREGGRAGRASAKALLQLGDARRLGWSRLGSACPQSVAPSAEPSPSSAACRRSRGSHGAGNAFLGPPRITPVPAWGCWGGRGAPSPPTASHSWVMLQTSSCAASTGWEWSWFVQKQRLHARIKQLLLLFKISPKICFL